MRKKAAVLIRGYLWAVIMATIHLAVQKQFPRLSDEIGVLLAGAAILFALGFLYAIAQLEEKWTRRKA